MQLLAMLVSVMVLDWRLFRQGIDTPARFRWTLFALAVITVLGGDIDVCFQFYEINVPPLTRIIQLPYAWQFISIAGLYWWLIGSDAENPLKLQKTQIAISLAVIILLSL